MTGDAQLYLVRQGVFIIKKTGTLRKKKLARVV